MVVEGDSNSQTITFSISRYFDATDLSKKTIKVGYYNAKGESATDDAHLNKLDLTSFTFDWTLSSGVAIKSGTVSIWVEFLNSDSSYVWKTKPRTFAVEPSFTVQNNVTNADITSQLAFLSNNDNLTVTDVADTNEPITVLGRRILMPILDDFVVCGDSQSQIISFKLDRYYNNIDHSLKKFAIKYSNPKNETDRADIVNKIVTDDTITFGWLIDNKVTCKEGYVKFAIEVLGYENGKFYCWSTRPAQFEVEQGLNVEGTITQPLPSIIQSWDLEKEAFLQEVLKNNTNVTYSTTTPIPSTLGGISTGRTYTNAKISDVLNDLLYPYIAPTITLSASISGGIREYGNPITSLDLTAITIRHTSPITSLCFYRDGVSINNVATPNPNGETKLFTETNVINTNCTFTGKVSDGTQTITSNTISYTFVYPMYIGNLSSTIPNETEIKTLEKKVVTKSNITKSYTVSDSRFCFAYPTSYASSLTSIKDANGFEIIDSFTKQTLNMTMLDGNIINYTVYISTLPTTQTSFSVSYIF
jgi:hypothetical protein